MEKAIPACRLASARLAPARRATGALAAAGADTFVAGNAIFTVPDAAAEVRELRRLAEAGATGRALRP